MPSALLRPCAAPRCPELVEKGRCAAHAREMDQRRAVKSSSHISGWLTLRARFRNKLVSHDIALVCGARLPGTVLTADSRCQADGLLVGDQPGQSLHADHIIPHHGDQTLFEDMANLQLLCRQCHSAKTMREIQGMR